jgi:SAM-dependent methyltransferase
VSRTDTSTDQHWGERARSVADDVEVNIMDVFQRELEYDHICKFLRADDTALEVGCGNGFSTQRFRSIVRFVDAFDSSRDMVERARARFGETNNRFFHDDVLEPRTIQDVYDVVLCVRVLINLRDLDEQLRAIANLARLTRPGGRLILVEGFVDGFQALSALRGGVNLPPVQPAAINSYSLLSDWQAELDRSFDLETTFHLGAYDVLTRVMYPLLAGEKLERNTVFHEKAAALARELDVAALEPYSRIRGLILRRR